MKGKIDENVSNKDTSNAMIKKGGGSGNWGESKMELTHCISTLMLVRFVPSSTPKKTYPLFVHSDEGEICPPSQKKTYPLLVLSDVAKICSPLQKILFHCLSILMLVRFVPPKKDSTIACPF